MNRDVALLVLTAVESVHAYSAFLPSVFTIRTFAQDAEARVRVRAGYVPAIVFSLVLGAAVAEITEQPAPLWAVVLVSAMMLVFYEWALSGY